MCLACTTLHGQAPRPETTTACSAPRMFAHYVREIIRQTNPDKYIRHLINVVDMDDSNTESDKGARTLSQANACSMVVICYVP